jgi:hypothetical protein
MSKILPRHKASPRKGDKINLNGEKKEENKRADVKNIRGMLQGKGLRVKVVSIGSTQSMNSIVLWRCIKYKTY